MKKFLTFFLALCLVFSLAACNLFDPSEEHIHTYSKATCTEAAKCSCGATSGDALGHSYVDGTCSVCGASLSVLNPKTELSANEYVGNLNVDGDMLVGAALLFDGEACVVTERFFNSVQSDPNQTPIVFEGKNYYSEGGSQDPHYYELTDTEILVKGSFWGEDAETVTLKLVLQGDGMLKVTYSANPLFPVGTILSTNINDVLR